MTALSYYVAAATASIFFILKACEEKFVSKNETFKINSILKASVFVYISCIISMALMDSIGESSIATKLPGAFLDKPAF